MMRVLLAGGGHTHLIAGPLLSRRLGTAADITLMASSEKLLYSGMMPGWLAGH
jgi:selenide,water dikinase